MDPQLIIVLIVVAAAAWFAGKRFIRQFSQSDDEAEGCNSCAVNEVKKAAENAKKKRAS